MRRFLMIIAASSCLYTLPARGGGCEPVEDPSWVNQVPRLITEPASWLVSGAGYLVDGAIYFTGATTVYGSVCAGPLLLAGVGRQFVGSDYFYSCISSVKSHVNDKYWDTDLGPAAYKGTKSWRCPQDWHLGLLP